MKVKSKITLSLISLFIFVLGSVYFMEQVLRYRHIPGDDGKVHQSVHKPICRTWHTQFEFQYGEGDTLYPSCEEALTHPGEDFFVSSANGLEIHFKHLQDQRSAPLSEEAPIWLHVHGITGDWLSAARYINSANFLKLRLVGMDLSNHGESSNDGNGAFWGCRESHDVVAVVKRLRDMYPKAPIFVTAVSMGTMAVARAEKEIRALGVKAIVLEAPIGNVISTVPSFARPITFLALTMRSWKDGLDLNVCDANEALPQFATPTLIVNVADDPFISKEDALAYFDRLPKDLDKRIVFFEKGIHTLAYNYNRIEFIQKFKDLYTSAMNADRDRLGQELK